MPAAAATRSRLSAMTRVIAIACVLATATLGPEVPQRAGARARCDRSARGALPGGLKAIPPRIATSIDITIPAAVNAIAIGGIRLEVTTRLGMQAYHTPGRPVAIVSNLRIDYTPTK